MSRTDDEEGKHKLHLCWRRYACMVILMGLTGCAMPPAGMFSAAPATVWLPRQQVQQHLQQYLLQTGGRRVLQGFDIRFSRPVVQLNAGQQRVWTQFDVVITPPLLGQAAQGQLLTSANLIFQAKNRSLHWQDVRVERFDVAGLPQYQEKLHAIGQILVRQLQTDAALYTFKPEELAGGADHTGTITLRNDGVAIQVTSQRR